MLAQQQPRTQKVILLTPIQRSQQMMGTIPTLAVIGTADPAYHAEQVVESDTLSWSVYEGFDHSLLKSDDLEASLDALQTIIATSRTFLIS